MKKKILCFVVFVTFNTLNIFAQQEKYIPQSQFAITLNNEVFRLGDKISKYLETNGYIAKEIRRTSNMEYELYCFRWGCFLTPKDKDAIFGIEIENNQSQNSFNIKIGDTKNKILSDMGRPNFQRDNGSIVYYKNDDWDMLELQLIFNEKNILIKLNMYLGT